MRVRNHTEANMQFMARMNAGKLINFKDTLGNEITKEETPQFEFINIPPKAEVEIDDDLWEKATSGSTKIKLYEDTIEDVPGAMIGDTKVTRTVREYTGKVKTVSLIKESIKAGQLEITEKPVSKLSKETKIETIKEAGLNIKATATDEQIDELYNKLVP